MNSAKILSVLSASVLATGLIALATSTAQAAESDSAKKYSAPKTEFGAPDLRGVWNFSSDTPLERPAQYKDREFFTKEEVEAQRAKVKARFDEAAKPTDLSDKASKSGDPGGYNQFWVESAAQDANLRTSLIIDPPNGRMPPMQPGVKVQAGGLGPDTGGQRPVRFRVGGTDKDGPESRGLSERCLMGFNSGPPFMPSMYNNNVQIFQTKTHAVIMTEMIHDARIVPLDNRPHVDSAITPWSGDSRGHWEGDTLVVDTLNFTDKIQSFRAAGTGKSFHLTERFTRVGKDRVDYQFTVDDPASFTKPITVLVPMIRAEGDLYEYACHEGNYGMSNILSGARQEEKAAPAKK
jgi:hypothetical protein